MTHRSPAATPVPPLWAAQPISWSQIRTYLHCPAEWTYRYVMGLPAPLTVELARGRAVHAAIQALALTDDPFEALHSAWRLLTPQLKEDDRQPGYAAAKRAVEAILHSSYPNRITIPDAGAEMHLAATLNGTRLHGIADVILFEERCIIDWKIRSRKPSSISGTDALQAHFYAFLGASHEIRSAEIVTVSTPAKSPATITTQLIDVSDSVGIMRRMLPPILQSMQQGFGHPNRTAPYCPNCAYRDVCARDFGPHQETLCQPSKHANCTPELALTA